MASGISLGFVDVSIIVLFISVIIFVGLFMSRKGGGSTKDFFLGGRNLPWYLAGVSMVATTFAADTPLAVTELVRFNGISGNWLWWNMLAGGMLTVFFFAKYWRRAEILTDVELVSIRYSGKEARFLRGFKALYMGVFLNACIIGWVNLALMTLLQVFFGLSRTEALWTTLAAMVIVYVYSGFSGLLGVVYTDFIQFIVAMTGSIILAVIVLNSDKVNGIAGLKDALPASALSFYPTLSNGTEVSKSAFLSLGLGSFLALIALPWWNSWYPGAEPGGGGYVAQRMMSARDEKNAVYANLLFQIAHYCIRPWPWILVALSALVLYPDLPAESARMGYVMAMKEFLPAGARGLLLAAFLAAYMSTVASQLNWGTSYIINDFYKPFIKSNATEKELVKASRISVFAMILVAFVVTSRIESISAVWNFLVQTGAGLGVVLILRWYWWRISAWSEIAATIAPFIGYAIVVGPLSSIDPAWAAPIIVNPKGFIFTISFTAICWVSVTLLTKPVEQEVLQNFYNRIRPQGNWAPFIEKGAMHHKNIVLLLMAWVFAIIMAYSLLFMSGSIVFRFWNNALLYAVTFGVSLMAMRYFSEKAKL